MDEQTQNTMIQSPVAPGTIGIALDPTLNEQPKQVLARLAREFPVNGMEPEQKAQMNMAAKLSAKAAADAKFFTTKADDIGGSIATIHAAQVEHKGNMMAHDLTVKAADVKHMSQIEGWQNKTVSLVEAAREKHAGIQLLHACL